MAGFDHGFAESRPRRQHDLGGFGRLLAALRDQALVGGEPRLALSLARARALLHPFELALERALTRRFLPAFLLEPLLFLPEPAGIIALIGNPLAAVELENPASDLVEEIAVVRHRDDGAGIFGQKALQPSHRFGVEMVGRLVEQEQIGLLQQQAAQRDAAPFAARELGDGGVAGRAAQRVHRDLDRAFDLPAVDRVDLFLELGLLGEQRVHRVVGQAFAQLGADRFEALEQRLDRAKTVGDVTGDRLFGIERRLLRQIAGGDAFGGPGLAGKIVLDPGHDAQQGRLARAVGAEHADLGPGQERQPDFLQHLAPAGKGLTQAFHHIDVLVGGHGNSGERWKARFGGRWWWARQDSNLRLHRYERRVLTAELRARANVSGGPESRHQVSRNERSLRDRLGCLSLRNALASIWRMRSRVTENCWPTSSRVWSVFMPMPKRMRSTRSSRGVRDASTRVVVSRRFALMAASMGSTALRSSMKSPRCESSSSPMGVSRLIGSLAIFRTLRTFSSGIASFSASSSGVGSRPISCSIWREVRTSLLIVSIMCTGMRIVRAWSAIERVIAWRIHQVA